jgi:hypothetical protein
MPESIDFKEEVAAQLSVLERCGLDMTHAHQANQVIRSLGGGRMVASNDDIALTNYYIILLFAQKFLSGAEVAA